jgi:O-antigen ligase
VGSLTERRWKALLFGLIFLAITATIFATQTRAALAGLLAGCMLAVLLLVRKRARLWTVAALAVLAVGATLWIQHTRGLGWVARRDPGTQYRWLMWQDGVRLAAQHPFFGVGMDSVQNHWQEWNVRAFERYHAYWNFHSDFVQIAAERGFLTLAAWLWFEIAYLVFLFRLLGRARQQNHFSATIVVGVLSGFVAFLFPSLVESALNDDALVMLLFFACGVALAIDRMLQQPGAFDVNRNDRMSGAASLPCTGKT